MASVGDSLISVSVRRVVVQVEKNEWVRVVRVVRVVVGKNGVQHLEEVVREFGIVQLGTGQVKILLSGCVWGSLVQSEKGRMVCEPGEVEVVMGCRDSDYAAGSHPGEEDRMVMLLMVVTSGQGQRCLEWGMRRISEPGFREGCGCGCEAGNAAVVGVHSSFR